APAEHRAQPAVARAGTDAQGLALHARFQPATVTASFIAAPGIAVPARFNGPLDKKAKIAGILLAPRFQQARQENPAIPPQETKESEMIVLKSTQDKVLAALQSVAGIVERRHTLPILANVLLRKTGPQLQLTTSDLEIQIRTTAELDGDEGNFATTLGARKLIDILRTMPADQTVSLENNAGKLILKGGKSRFTLQSLPAEDFPLVQESASFGPAFSVPQKTLKNLLGQVSFAMAVHDIRYYL